MQKLWLIVSLFCLALGSCSDVNLGSNGVDGASGSEAGTPDAQVVCDQLAAAAQAQFQSFLDSTSLLACQVDSDCRFVYLDSLDCFAACGMLMGTAAISAVTTAATGFCDQYFAAGCPAIHPPCPYGQSTCGCDQTSCPSPPFPSGVCGCDHGQCVWGSPSSHDAAAGGASGGSSGAGGVAGSTSPGGTGGAGGATDAAVAPTGGAGGAVGNPGGQTGTDAPIGTGGTGGAAIDASGPPPTDGGAGPIDLGTTTCTFDVKIALSPKIATVGIVTWDTSLPNLEEAHIDFGLTTAYGMTAPVNLSAPDKRTLLLGLKPQQHYRFRIVASDGAVLCNSPDYMLATGSLSPSPTKITISTKSTVSPTYGGFLLVGSFLPNAGASSADAGYIVDADGEVVWAGQGGSGDTTCVRMDYSGTHMWLARTNVPDSGASVHRITMDGLTDEDFSSKFVGQHLRLTVLPDETVAFAAYGANGCDDIKELSPGGTVRTVANAAAAQGLVGSCQVVDVQYSKDDDTVVFSDLINQSVVKVRRSDGTTLWILNGLHPTLAGGTWQGGQWGLQVLGQDRVLLFASNSRISSSSGGGSGTGDGSSAIELSLDRAGMTATQVWSYKANPGVQADVLGDVQRLPGGNTIVAFSSQGKIHEVDATSVLLQEWVWPVGAMPGYVERRATLYGPPPR